MLALPVQGGHHVGFQHLQTHSHSQYMPFAPGNVCGWVWSSPIMLRCWHFWWSHTQGWSPRGLPTPADTQSLTVHAICTRQCLRVGLVVAHNAQVLALLVVTHTRVVTTWASNTCRHTVTHSTCHLHPAMFAGGFGRRP